MKDYVDYKGRRYFAPYRCFCCGKEISRDQFIFSTLCPTCDTGDCIVYGDSKAYMKHPSFDPSTIYSESIPKDEEEIEEERIQALMYKMGYSTVKFKKYKLPDYP
jgi:hypothetical protein